MGSGLRAFVSAVEVSDGFTLVYGSRMSLPFACHIWSKLGHHLFTFSTPLKEAAILDQCS